MRFHTVTRSESAGQRVVLLSIVTLRLSICDEPPIAGFPSSYLDFPYAPGSTMRIILTLFAVLFIAAPAARGDDKQPLRVFIFAGQSNMVGSDSKVRDIKRFPPFAGLEKAQTQVKFAYCIGRKNKTRSDGWVDLQPVNDIVGPELSFARQVARHSDGPIAIIKCAAGGTHLGGDWNPDDPQGFKMYPLALDLIRKSLADLDRLKIAYRIEGFMWHQGENDMFNEGYMKNYGANLKQFLSRWRRDLNAPQLRFYIGELCTKTIWGMDLRPRMYAISRGQRMVTQSDPLAEYVPTSHVGVEIGGGVGLHYHYGTLGQLEHGVNYANAYLKSIGKSESKPRKLPTWPYRKKTPVRLFVLAGHRNMEGERAFVQELRSLPGKLHQDDARVAFKYSLGGGYKTSRGWEPLGPAGYYDTFGPELSFGRALQEKGESGIAIAKFTHSGSQMNDWTPTGTPARTRHVYPDFIRFIRTALADLRGKGHHVELAGVFYHVGENEMSMPPYRKEAANWLKSMIEQSRRDLALPGLRWFVSQQPPTNDKRVNAIDVTRAIEKVAAGDKNLIHIKAFDLPRQEKKLVIDTKGIVGLGELIAAAYLKQPRPTKQPRPPKKPARPRTSDLGIRIGILQPGKRNAITDVADVRVGHLTLQKGRDIRTGVTVILPHGGNIFQDKVPAAIAVGNGFGKFLGATQVNELGVLETPIGLTNTLSSFTVADAIVTHTLRQAGNEGVRSVNPVVGECNDGALNDIRARNVRPQHVLDAIAKASTGPIAEGSVGAGTGTRCMGWKGGIGTASRRLPAKSGGHTVGVLVQTNFNGVLNIGGAPVGRELGRYFMKDQVEDRKVPERGSCIIVIATDAPLDARQLKRLARRGLLGLSAVGSPMTHGSGDYAVAFSTDKGVRLKSRSRQAVRSLTVLRDDRMSPLFLAAKEATEEAVINSLLKATTTTGNGRTSTAIPIDRVIQICKRYRVIR